LKKATRKVTLNLRAMNINHRRIEKVICTSPNSTVKGITALLAKKIEDNLGIEEGIPFKKNAVIHEINRMITKKQIVVSSNIFMLLEESPFKALIDN
jgi:hypothetical protein